MFVVRGVTRQGLVYRMGIGSEVQNEPSARGQVMGPAQVMALLVLNEGRSVKVTPTGPVVKLDLDDPSSILGALYALTEVTEVAGEGIPQVIPELGPDEVG
jgi:hypothetical protein